MPAPVGAAIAQTPEASNSLLNIVNISHGSTSAILWYLLSGDCWKVQKIDHGFQNPRGKHPGSLNKDGSGFVYIFCGKILNFLF